MIAVTDGGNKRCTDVVQSSGFSDATIQSDTLSDFDNAGTTVSKYHAVPVITVTSAGLKLIRRLSFRLSVTILGHWTCRPIQSSNPGFVYVSEGLIH